MKLKCMIVDDEPLATELLETHISSITELELMATCSNAIEANLKLREISVDLLFLDIQMPKLNGIEFIKTLPHKPRSIIITSAFQEYAYEAFQIDAIDYLLKPISFERFLVSVNKVYNKLHPSPTENRQLSKDLSMAYIFVKVNRKMEKIAIQEIVYLESMRDSVKIVTRSNSFIAQQQISSMEDKLPGDSFLRVHRSFIISLNQINTFSANTIELGDTVLPIGRSYKELVMKRLNASS